MKLEMAWRTLREMSYCYNGDENSRNYSPLRRLFFRICSSRFGIRALVSVILFVTASWLVLSNLLTITPIEDRPSASKFKIRVDSLPPSPTQTAGPSSYQHNGTERNDDARILVDELRTQINHSSNHFPSTGPPLNTSPQKFHPQPIPKATTDLDISNIYDSMKLPSLNQHVNWVDFDDDDVKRRLTARLEPKVWSTKNKLKVFLVLHSHNDAGWLKTFKQYYSELTKHILDHILDGLTKDPELKFIWAEMSFFSLWWNDLTREKRLKVQKLVDNKQLEFVSGGWVMPDEASVHYASYFTQLIEGHQFLKQHLNYTPTTGWAIDPFGLSSSLNYLQGRSGIKSTVFNRVHYVLKQYLREKKSMEFCWRQPWDSKGSHDVLSYLMPYYSYDRGHTCGPDSTAICTSFNNPQTNTSLNETATSILEQLKKKSLIFKTNNLLWPVGGDFHWHTAKEWNEYIPTLKTIMKYINSHAELFTEMAFSTLDDYFTAVRSEIQERKMHTETLSGDFFTYSGEKLDYWSGYFTSRMFHKTAERQLMSYLRSAQIAFIIMTAEISKYHGTANFNFIIDLLKLLVTSRRHLSVFQHHDGITGTSKAAVVIDYAKTLYESMLYCQFIEQQSLFILTHLKRFQSGKLELAHITNSVFYDPIAVKTGSYQNNWKISVFEVNEKTQYKIITVYNSLEVNRKELVQIRVKSLNVKVVTVLDNEVVDFEIFPTFKMQTKSADHNITNFETEGNKFELYFLANLKPLEVKNYKLFYVPDGNLNAPTAKFEFFNAKSNLSKKFTKDSQEQQRSSNKTIPIKISNDHFQITFNEYGTAKSLVINGSSHKFEISFRSFTSQYGSGVYSFTPNGKQSKPIDFKRPPILVAHGKLKSYVEVWFPTVVHRLTLNSIKGFEDHAIEVQNTIDITKKENYELLMRITTNISSNNTFYTDSNGFQMMKRQTRNNIPIQGNYYPVAASAFIEDEHNRLTIVTAQPNAAASFKSGELELIQDRIVHRDDGHGMDESVTDNLKTISKFKILVEQMRNSDTFESSKGFVPSLSIGAHHQFNSLLHPLQGFVLKEKSTNLDKTNTSLNSNDSKIRRKNTITDLESPTDYVPGSGKSFPCDVHLVGTHSLPEYQDSKVMNDSRIFIGPGKVGLMFHRIIFDGRIYSDYMTERCSDAMQDAGVVKISDVFQDLFEAQMEKTSVTFVHSYGKVSSNEAIPLERMELYGFVAKFREKSNLNTTTTVFDIGL